MKVIAKVPVLYRGKQYKVGESLPADDSEMLKLWEEAGSVEIISDAITESENEETPEDKNEESEDENEEVAPVQPENNAEIVVSETKAVPETAEAGLEGMAVNGETEENLVGKVPKTPARKRK